MFIFKSALRSISRAKGRNILIGLIVLVIAVSACIALSIKEAALKARDDTLRTMQITAQISVDRSAMMAAATASGSSTDRDSMRKALQSMPTLTLDEYQKYAKADSVASFYYSLSTSLDAGGSLEPVDTNGTFAAEQSDSGQTSSTQSSAGQTSKSGQSTPPDMSGFGGKGFMGRQGSQGDFTITGYSSDAAMTAFVDGTATITSGAMFEEGTSTNSCVISNELATYNKLAVGDTISLVNPNDEDETVALKISGIYTNSAADGETESAFSTAGDSANAIYMSYPALKAIADKSAAGATTSTDSTTGLTSSTAIANQLSATYVFDGLEDYEAFEAQTRALGLSDSFTVSSDNVTAFEQSLTPLENLSRMATYFLIVVFAIGAVILVVLNIFNIRERKYEIGVLTAIGMKKRKVALQFITELFVVTLTAILIGAGIGAATSVPVTNALLSGQISSNAAAAETAQQGFGRTPGSNIPSGATDKSMMIPGGAGFSNAGGQNGKGFMGAATNYLSEISYSTDLNVIMELIAVGIVLTCISSLAAVLFIMRYEPLKILTSRD